MPKLKPNRALRGGKSPVHNSDHRSTLWERRTLMSKQGGLCALCGKAMASADITLDHIQPVSKGGLDTITNLQLAHRECNERKGAA